MDSVMEMKGPRAERTFRLSLVPVCVSGDVERIDGREMFRRGRKDTSVITLPWLLTSMFIGNTCAMPQEWSSESGMTIIIPTVAFTDSDGMEYVQGMKSDGPNSWDWRWVFFPLDDTFGAECYFLKVV